MISILHPNYTHTHTQGVKVDSFHSNEVKIKIVKLCHHLHLRLTLGGNCHTADQTHISSTVNASCDADSFIILIRYYSSIWLHPFSHRVEKIAAAVAAATVTDANAAAAATDANAAADAAAT